MTRRKTDPGEFRAPWASPYLQRYVVTMESGAIYLAHVMACDVPTGKDAATAWAEQKDGGPAWAKPCPVPGLRDGEQAGPGIELLRGPRATSADDRGQA